MPKNNKQTKSILFVLEHFYPYIGGAEKLFYILTKSLARQGFDVHVITTKFHKDLLEEEIFEGVKITRVACYNRYAFTLFSLPKVWKFARQVDYIHTTTYNAALPAVLVGKLQGKPVFVTFHEVWGELWRRLPFSSFFQRNAFYFFEKMLLKLPFSKFIAVSQFTKNALQLHGIPSEKIVRIYNGLDYEIFKNYTSTPPQKFTYTYFGRLGISKGLDLLLPAAATFRQKFPDSTFRLILPKQPAAFFKKIKTLTAELDLENYIEWHHNLRRTELYHQLSTSSCVVISSYSEGFCFAAAEAVAINIPIISSNQGALKETVSGKHILMEEMTQEALSNALEHAYNSNWSEKTIRKFRLEDSEQAYLEFYNSVV